MRPRSSFLLLCAALIVGAGCGAPGPGHSARVPGGATTKEPAWLAPLGYGAGDVFPVRRGFQGMPFVEVSLGGSSHWLLFDTGNMVGLTLATPLLDKLGLPVVGQWERLGSDGHVIGVYRRSRAPSVKVLGRVLADQTVYEFSDARLGGLVGPDALPGSRFTLDYRSRVLAVTNAPVPGVPRGFTALPLTRSARVPRLVLASGRANGRPVLMECDTGASRTIVDPSLVQELRLPAAGDGVRIDSLAIGPLLFKVRSAKVVPKTGIDPDLNPPIQLSVGSDLLSRLILTVDYERGQMLLSEASGR